MTNKSKAKGTAFESLIRDYLKFEWDDSIERMTLSGSDDRGDIAGFRVGEHGHLVALELKNCKQMSLSQWVKEAQKEAENYGAVAGATIHKRVGQGAAGMQYVTLTLSDLLTILHAAAL